MSIMGPLFLCIEGIQFRPDHSRLQATPQSNFLKRMVSLHMADHIRHIGPIPRGE
jgi:hypothetical protein